jgi:hypothetical protein
VRLTSFFGCYLPQKSCDQRSLAVQIYFSLSFDHVKTGSIFFRTRYEGLSQCQSSFGLCGWSAHWMEPFSFQRRAAMALSKST